MYVEGVEDGKEHIHTFLLITSLIFNEFSIQKKFWKTETYFMNVKDVKGQNNLRHLPHALT